MWAAASVGFGYLTNAVEYYPGLHFAGCFLVLSWPPVGWPVFLMGTYAGTLCRRHPDLDDPLPWPRSLARLIPLPGLGAWGQPEETGGRTIRNTYCQDWVGIGRGVGPAGDACPVCLVV
jgi:hypothetical protein